MSKPKKLGKPGEILPGDKFPLEGKELTPLGEYLTAYGAMLYGQLSLVMADTQAKTAAEAATVWAGFTSGIMYLLTLPAKASKAIKGKPTLTLTDHLTLLGLTLADYNRLRWEKECRATWNKSRDAIKTQYGIEVGNMPDGFPDMHKARIEAEARDKAAAIVAEATAPKAEEVPQAPQIAPLAAIVPSMALVPVTGIMADSALSVPQESDNGELPTPTVPETPAIADAPGVSVAVAAAVEAFDAKVAEGEPLPTPTEPEAIASVSTQDAPVGGDTVAAVSDTEPLAIEPVADSACTNCEPDAVATEASQEVPGPLPVGELASGAESPETTDCGPSEGEHTDPIAQAAAEAVALAIVPTGEHSPLDGGQPQAEAEVIASDTGTEATEGSPGEQAASGFVQVADAAPLVVASEAGEQGSSEGQGDSPLPEATAVVNEAVAVAGDAGQPQTEAPKPVGDATEAVASSEPEPEPIAGIEGTPGLASFVEPMVSGETLEQLPLVPSAEAVALANASPEGAIVEAGDPSPDPFAEEAAEVDAKLDIAWSEHCANPCEKSARHVRAIARWALNEHPKVFSHQDLHKWRDKTRAYIPQTGSMGRKGHLTLAYAQASIQEEATTPQQEETGAILATARAALLPDTGAGNDNGTLPDEGRGGPKV